MSATSYFVTDNGTRLPVDDGYLLPFLSPTSPGTARGSRSAPSRGCTRAAASSGIAARFRALPAPEHGEHRPEHDTRQHASSHRSSMHRP